MSRKFKRQIATTFNEIHSLCSHWGLSDRTLQRHDRICSHKVEGPDYRRAGLGYQCGLLCFCCLDPDRLEICSSGYRWNWIAVSVHILVRINSDGYVFAALSEVEPGKFHCTSNYTKQTLLELPSDFVS